MEEKDSVVKHQKNDNSEILKRRSERQNVETSQRQTLKDITAGFNTRTRCGVSSRTGCRRVFQNGYKHRVISCEAIASHTVCISFSTLSVNEQVRLRKKQYSSTIDL